MAFKNILPLVILFMAVAATIVQASEDSEAHNGMYPSYTIKIYYTAFLKILGKYFFEV